MPTSSSFRTQTAIAAALGITQPVSPGHVVPDQYKFQIEVITAGALRVEPELRKPCAGRAVFEY
jgi:hypothetical protein